VHKALHDSWASENLRFLYTSFRLTYLVLHPAMLYWQLVKFRGVVLIWQFQNYLPLSDTIFDLIVLWLAPWYCNMPTLPVSTVVALCMAGFHVYKLLPLQLLNFIAQTGNPGNLNPKVYRKVWYISRHRLMHPQQILLCIVLTDQ